MQPALARDAFAALTREVDALVRGHSSFERNGWELVFFLLRCALLVAGMLILSRQGWAAKTLGLAVAAYAYYGVAITGVHEASHNAFASSRRVNRWWSHFFSDFWSGQSSEWWHHRHVSVHHAFTNIPDKDPQLFFFPWIDKYAYFFGVPFLLVPWLAVHSVLFLKRRPKELALFLALAAAGMAFHFGLFRFVLPPTQAALAAFAMRSLYAPIFMHLAVFNHIGLDNPKSRMPWLPHQTRTTRNVAANWFLSGLGGNAFLDCHLEHHLFPGLSNRMLARAKPLVRRALESQGYRYEETGYLHCLKTGLVYYDSLFTQGAPTVSGLAQPQ